MENAWNTIYWDGYVLEDPDKSEDVEFRDSNEIILPVEDIAQPTVTVASPSTSPVMLAYPHMYLIYLHADETSPVLTKHENSDIPEDLISLLTTSQKTEARGVTHVEIYYSPHELTEFSDSYKQRCEE